ncbi:MAG: hypothetical protein AAFN78_15105 [Pseudomonadota bacterium]
MIRNTLHFSPWWFAGGMGLVLLVVVGSLYTADVPGPPLPSDKLVHTFCYFVLMAWFGGVYQRSAHWRVALALCLLGVVLEGLQALGGVRQGDLLDALANSVGIVIGMVPGLLIPGGWCRYAERIVVR